MRATKTLKTCDSSSRITPMREISNEEYGAFLEANEYDTALAGSRLLGADARRVLSAETRETIGEICRTFRGEMESAMSRNRFLERGDRADELLAQFLMGLETELPISGSS
jgi:predicted nucleotidyltransferase